MTAIGIDIGNSSAKLYRLPDQPRSRRDAPDARWVIGLGHRVAAKEVDEVLKRVHGLAPRPGRVHVVSVDPRFCERLRRRWSDAAGTLRVWETSDIPLTHPYEDATRLGADRVLAAHAARWLSGGEAAIVVDAGTAVTVDVVDGGGAFRGGAIAPGLSVLAEALGRRGAQLEPVDPRHVPDYPGTSTGDCLALGVSAAFEGAVARLVERARGLLPSAGVWVTGGDGEVAAAVLGAKDVHVCPELMHVGLALLEHGDG